MSFVSVVSCCYNEAENIEKLINRIESALLGKCEYEIIVGDNDSTDGTQEILRRIAKNDKHVKVIYNQRNYGPTLSSINAFKHAKGDLVIGLASDLQDPPELLPTFIEEWEKNNKIVCGTKIKSQEGMVKHGLRSLFYAIIKSLSSEKQYSHISGISLFDKEIMKRILEFEKENGENIPFRWILPKLNEKIKLVPYIQQKREGGKSSYNVSRYFNFAIESLIYTADAPFRKIMLTSWCVWLLHFAFIMVGIFRSWGSLFLGITSLMISISLQVIMMIIWLVSEYFLWWIRKGSKGRIQVIEKETLNFD